MPSPSILTVAAAAQACGPAALMPGVPVLLPLAGMHVRAGFTSPAEDFLDKRIDLNEVMVTHPQATFLLRVSGDSMIQAGIHHDDILLVNRAIRPRHRSVVVAIVDGEFTCKYLHSRLGRIKLVAANPTFPEIVPKDGQTLEVWGVCQWNLKKLG
jgi:DNA polymerase V